MSIIFYDLGEKAKKFLTLTGPNFMTRGSFLASDILNGLSGQYFSYDWCSGSHKSSATSYDDIKIAILSTSLFLLFNFILSLQVFTDTSVLLLRYHTKKTI